MSERTQEKCLRYTGNVKCHYTGKECNSEVVKTCKSYKPDTGTYYCPYCHRTGLKQFNYGSEDNPEIVWECLRCGGELWDCPTVTEMLERCLEMTKKEKEENSG